MHNEIHMLLESDFDKHFLETSFFSISSRQLLIAYMYYIKNSYEGMLPRWQPTCLKGNLIPLREKKMIKGQWVSEVNINLKAFIS